MAKRVRTWAELEAWFTGEAEGEAVFYSPATTDDWDDLWLRLGEKSEVGRGMRSFSLSQGDLLWLRTVLTLASPKLSDGRVDLQQKLEP